MDLSTTEQADFTVSYDALFNVTTGLWLKRPVLVDPSTWDREALLGRVHDQTLAWAQSWDLSLGALRRSARDFDQVTQHLKMLDQAELSDLQGEIQGLLDAMEAEISEMSDEYREILEQRREAYHSFEGDVDELWGYINALPEVLQMKMLNHWGYFSIIRELEALLADGELSPGEAAKVSQVVEGKGMKTIGIRSDLHEFTPGPLLFADLANQIHKLATEALQDAVKVQREAGAGATESDNLGAAQEDLSMARSEEEIRAVWEKYGLTPAFDELRQMAGGEADE